MNSDRKLIDPYIYDRLPDDLKRLTQEFKGRERDIILLSSLGVLSNCFPNLYGNYDGRDVYPQLYIMIIAPPASGKGVMNYSRSIIDPINDEMFVKSKIKYLDCVEKSKGKKAQIEKCPKIEIKLLPANISTSEMYSYFETSKHGLLMMESEADTMSNMFKNDWSNYSDVLRKAAHHEPISISRKVEDIFENIKEPKLAMVISGTPDQLKPLVKSTKNGLYSRYIVYNFDEISEFKRVFDKNLRGIKDVFSSLGQEIFDLFKSLQKLTQPIEFSFSEAQNEKFYARIEPLRTDIVENHSRGFVANLFRHALIWFRIAMILSAIRNKDKLPTLNKLQCTNEDFILAMNLTKTLLEHSQYTYDTMDNNTLYHKDNKILSELEINFTTQCAYDAGEKHGVIPRTITDKLVQWQKKGIIAKIQKGQYVKIMKD